MRSRPRRRVIVPLAVVTALAGLTVLLATASGGNASPSVALAGGLDPSFGNGGIVTHGLGSNTALFITGIVVQPDGKIVVTGRSASKDAQVRWLLARYLPNGSPDPSFGDGGYVETKFADTLGGYAGAIALQPNGKIVVAGISPREGDIYGDFALARFNPSGSLDTSFGTDGITTTAVPEPPQFRTGPGTGIGCACGYAEAVAVLPNREIVVGGTANTSWVSWDPSKEIPEVTLFALAGYKPDGSLDAAFGDAGIAQTRFDGNLLLAGIAVRPNGKIVATGTASDAKDDSTHRIAVVQYRSDGSLDPTFGRHGKAATLAAQNNGGGQPALQDGKIVVAAGAGLARFSASGRLDTTFGKHGFAATPLSPPTDVRVQKDGKIVVATLRGVARLLPNGRLDRSFGKQGSADLSTPGYPALAVQGDGKVLAGSGKVPRGNSGGVWTLFRLLGGNNCVVPVLRGKTVPQATVTLKRSFCSRGSIATRFSSTVARGRVITTTPARGARLRGGAKVALVVSRGHRS